MKKYGFKLLHCREVERLLSIMKITFALLIFCLVGLQANITTYSQTTKLTLNMKGATVKQVFDEIEKSSEFIFLYSNDVIDLNKKVNLDIKYCTIDETLDRLFKFTNNSYEVIDRQIVIKPVQTTVFPVNLGISESYQTQKVTGQVTDIKNEPLPGVNVLVKGTTLGTVTDIDGKFTISIPTTTAVLQFSFIGYITEEREVKGSEILNITLLENIKSLEEVVVVGYGAQKKESVVGAISQTSNEQLKRSGNVSDLKQALTGQLPGVVTITASGEPGGTGTGSSATSIFIRGQNTWNGGQPLILVDGVERNMDNLDVGEVESVSILKDASATAVFGVKGANGVILITTKRGIVNKPQLSFSYNSTALSVSKLPQKLDSYEALLIKNESIEREVVLNESSWADYKPYEIVTRYKTPQNAQYAQIYPNVDWKEAMFKDISWSNRASMNVQGGTKFVNYFGSLAYLHEGDMFKEYENFKGYEPNYDFDRFNFRSNLDFKLTQTTTLKVDLSGFYSQKNTNNAYNNISSGTSPLAWSAVYSMPPDVCLPQYSDGRWGSSYELPAEQLQNPIALIYNTGILERRTTELDAGFSLDQKLDFITKGLTAKASLFYDNSIQTTSGLNDVTNHVRPDNGSNTPEKIINSKLYVGPDQDPSVYTSNIPNSSTYLFDWVVSPWNLVDETVATAAYTGYIPIERRLMYQLQLNYARKFNKNSVSGTGVFKREEYARGSMFKNYREDWVFRGTYDYDTRYLFEMNGAYNGSEQFGPGYRFDFFPSVALGWYISNEKFFKIDWINRLKVRYSIGMVGDDKGSGGRWLYSSQYGYGGGARMNQNPNETSPYTWYKESNVGNPDIHWEKARKDNIGLELGIFENLLSANFEYFTEDRTDIMLAGTARSSVPPYFGATPPSANIGHVKSKGYEIELKLDKRTNQGLHVWSTLAIAHTTNKILDKDDPALLASYLKAEGYAIGQTRSQIRSGFYNNWDEVYASVPQESNDGAKLPGYYNILDFNGDGVITNDDNTPIGYPEVPQNTYNFSVGGSYKGFSFMAQLYSVNNVSRYIPLKNFYLYQDVLFDHVSDYWSKDNTDATSFIPRWKTQGQFIGDYFIFDGSFIRLKTVEVAYTFTDKWIKKVGLTSFRIFLNGNNLMFWSKLPDDRESAWSGGGAADGAYPTSRRVNLGFDLNF